MAGIIENFKLDMADDHDLTFSEASEVVELLINHQKLTNPRIARQKIVNLFADAIRKDYQAAEEAFLGALSVKADLKKEISRLESEKLHRSIEHSFKRMEKFIARYA